MGAMTQPAGRDRPAAKPKARDLNQVIRYTMWSVFRVARPARPTTGPRVAAEVEELFDQLAAKDVVDPRHLRRRGLRADADLMIWWHAPSVRRPAGGVRAGSAAPRSARACEPVWSVMALHRPAEFNKSHVPAFLAEEEPRDYVCVYPFVRSYDWYLLPDEERRAMLAEHGQMARGYPDVRANTVSSFALGDYEWMLAFEADELHRIVDLMRHLRGVARPACTSARRCRSTPAAASRSSELVRGAAVSRSVSASRTAPTGTSPEADVPARWSSSTAAAPRPVARRRGAGSVTGSAAGRG